MKRWLVVFTALSLLLPVMLPACGKEKEKTPAPTPTTTATIATPVPTYTTTPTPTTSPTRAKEPVKIGAIIAWSGPMAMSGVLTDQILALVDQQVKDMGGILGGREVKFVKGDDGGTVAGSSGQARKLILEDKVTVLTMGGETMAQFTAVADVAEELKVPYIAMSTISGLAARKYSASLYSYESYFARTANFILDVVKPKTVAWLAVEDIMSHAHFEGEGAEGVVGVKDRLKAKGITIVYEEYFPQGTMDLSPYLTKIKYLKPDLLVTFLNDTGQAITINKQIMELGGWGSIKYFSATETGSAKAAVTLPSAVGTYVGALWLAGSEDVGMKAFEDAFTQKYNRLPDPAMTYFYNCLWTAIKVIELAGTDDHDKVAQALRSGNLEWDSAWGHLRINTDGIGAFKGAVVQVQEGGKMVKVWPQ